MNLENMEMGILNKLQHNLKRLQRKKDDNVLDFSDVKEIEHQQHTYETYKSIELPKDELVSFSDEVLDTNSRETIEKFKHNLEILIRRAKEKGKVDKFMLIREDDYFPYDWKWRVLSPNTNLEKVSTSLSYELRKAYE